MRLALVLFVVGFAGCGGPEFEGTTEVFGMSSDAVGDEFEIQVHLPPGHDPNQPLPVVYVLDGSTLSEPTAGRLARRGHHVVVVGVGYDDGFSPDRRRRDYTPTEDAIYPMATGGGPAFLAFLRDDLLPRIEADFAVTGHRTLLGHSQGGLFATYALTRHNPEDPAFGAYVAASPALWWDSGVILDRLDAAGPLGSGSRVPYFVAVGELEPITFHAYIDEIQDRLAERADEGLDVARRTYADAVHDATWERAFPQGLDFAEGEEL